MRLVISEPEAAGDRCAPCNLGRVPMEGSPGPSELALDTGLARIACIGTDTNPGVDRVCTIRLSSLSGSLASKNHKLTVCFLNQVWRCLLG
jgi:hypothetical protein